RRKEDRGAQQRRGADSRTISARAADAASGRAHQVFLRPAGRHAGERGGVHCGRDAADGNRGRGSVVRGIGGAGNRRRGRRIQGGGGEEHGTGVQEPVDPYHHYKERGRLGAFRRSFESRISARGDGGYGFSLSRPHRGGSGERARGGGHAPTLRAADQRMVLRAGGSDSASGRGGGQSIAAADRHQHEKRGTDQACFQRIPGDEDFLYQRRGIDLRIGGGERAAGVRRDRNGFADRAALHESGDRLRRLVLSERPDGVPGGRQGKRIRLPAAGRSHPY